LLHIIQVASEQQKVILVYINKFVGTFYLRFFTLQMIQYFTILTFAPIEKWH